MSISLSSTSIPSSSRRSRFASHDHLLDVVAHGGAERVLDRLGEPCPLVKVERVLRLLGRAPRGGAGATARSSPEPITGRLELPPCPWYRFQKDGFCDRAEGATRSMSLPCPSLPMPIAD